VSPALQALQKEVNALSETVKNHAIELPKKAYPEDVKGWIAAAKSDIDGKITVLDIRVKALETALPTKATLD